MSFKLTLKSLLSETKKMVNYGSQRADYFKEEIYRHVSQSYSKLNQIERYEYLRELSHMHDYSKDKLFNLKYQDTTSDALRTRRMFNIKESLQPKYRDFFINLGRVPDGIKLLVDLRSDIIEIQKMLSNPTFNETVNTKAELTRQLQNNSRGVMDRNNTEGSMDRILYSLSLPENSSDLFVLNAELKDLINVWFAGGFCQLERVTWNSSCQLLQRISELEAVHPVKGWADIKRRVGAYRRCYVFTHPCMPREPVVILHSALCSEIPASIREVVLRRFSKPNVNLEETEDPSKIKAAIFYSISSPHNGLNGIDLGNTLIKRVVQALLFEFPFLDQFSTLSPVPGFRSWLDALIQKCLNHEINNRIIPSESMEESYIDRLLSPAELQILSEHFQTTTLKDLLGRLQVVLESIKFHYNTSKDLPDSHDQVNSDNMVLSWFLKTVATKYLCNEKRRGYALDTVCNFHLKNGAVLWRINWLADSSPRGIQNSYGLMVNYRYYIEHTEIYSRQYMENKTIEMSSEVRNILLGSSLCSKDDKS